MQFRAALKVQTTVHRVWTGRRLRRCTIDGVPFHLVGNRFVSVDDPLSADDVAVLSMNNQVQLEMSGLPTSEVVIEDPKVPVKTAEPAQKAEPVPASEPELKPEVQTLSLPPSNKMKVDLKAPPRGYQGSQRHR